MGWFTRKDAPGKPPFEAMRLPKPGAADEMEFLDWMIDSGLADIAVCIAGGGLCIGGHLLAKPGDWVVRVDEFYYVYPNDAFERLYKPAVKPAQQRQSTAPNTTEGSAKALRALDEARVAARLLIHSTDPITQQAAHVICQRLATIEGALK